MYVAKNCFDLLDRWFFCNCARFRCLCRATKSKLILIKKIGINDDLLCEVLIELSGNCGPLASDYGESPSWTCVTIELAVAPWTSEFCWFSSWSSVDISIDFNYEERFPLWICVAFCNLVIQISFVCPGQASPLDWSDELRGLWVVWIGTASQSEDIS